MVRLVLARYILGLPYTRPNRWRFWSCEKWWHFSQLHGIKSRWILLHNGTVRSLRYLFDTTKPKYSEL